MTVEDQVKALRAKFGDRIPNHDCALCGRWVAYVFIGEQLFFDSNCGCVNYETDYQPRDISDLHQFLKINPGWTERLIKSERL